MDVGSQQVRRSVFVGAHVGQVIENLPGKLDLLPGDAGVWRVIDVAHVIHGDLARLGGGDRALVAKAVWRADVFGGDFADGQIDQRSAAGRQGVQTDQHRAAQYEKHGQQRHACLRRQISEPFAVQRADGCKAVQQWVHVQQQA